MASASPDAPTFPLEWRAPSVCGSEAEFQSAVNQRLPEASKPARPLTFVVEVRRVGDEFELRLVIADAGERSERVLAAAGCRELVETAALIVAMAIDPRVAAVEPAESVALDGRSGQDGLPSPPPGTSAGDPVGRPRASTTDRVAPPVAEVPLDPVDPAAAPATTEPGAVGPAPVATDVPPAPASPTASSGRAGRLLQLWGGASVGVGWGPLPRAAATLEVRLALAGRYWRAELAAEGWLPSSEAATNDPELRLRTQMWGGSVRGCGEPGISRFTFPLCLGVRAAAAIGRGEGTAFVEQTLVGRPWLGLSGGAGAVAWLAQGRLLPGRVGLELRVRGHVALVRPSFDTAPSGNVLHRAGRGGAEVVFGVNLRAW